MGDDFDCAGCPHKKSEHYVTGYLKAPCGFPGCECEGLIKGPEAAQAPMGDSAAVVATQLVEVVLESEPSVIVDPSLDWVKVDIGE